MTVRWPCFEWRSTATSRTSRGSTSSVSTGPRRTVKQLIPRHDGQWSGGSTTEPADVRSNPVATRRGCCVHQPTQGEIMCDLCSAGDSIDRPKNSLGRRSVLAAAAATPALVALSNAARAEAKPRRQSHLELVLLGTKAGPPIDPLRTGIASALIVDGATYLIDCGRSSATQYIRAGLKLKALRGMFLTHLHADHIADYYNFFLLGGSVPNQEGDSMPDVVPVYGPGPAGGLPPKFGGGISPTIDPSDPTPGIADLTKSCDSAYAYSSNVFMRDMGIRDIRDLADVHEITVPNVGATYENTAPVMDPFVVMQDENVRVLAILVPHGPVFPSFA